MNGIAGKRILVTGAAGFIGSNLSRELVRLGAEVYCLVRPSTDLWRIRGVCSQLVVERVDLRDFEATRRAVDGIHPEIVFHLAAPGGHPSRGTDRLEMLQSALMGTTNLLEATARKDYQCFVHVCGSTAYRPRNVPLREEELLEPSSYRGAVKAATSILCQQWARENGRPIVIVRPFSVYGYWEADTRLVPAAVLAALRRRRFNLTTPGYRRDFIFVSDVVEACLMATQAKGLCGEIINVGTGRQWSNEEVIDLIERLTGYKMDVRVGAYPASPSDTANWVADVVKAKKLLGWEPEHEFARGLEKTISWFRLNLDEYSTQKFHNPQ